jgi:hypothetical protein
MRTLSLVTVGCGLSMSPVCFAGTDACQLDAVASLLTMICLPKLLPPKLTIVVTNHRFDVLS